MDRNTKIVLLETAMVVALAIAALILFTAYRAQQAQDRAAPAACGGCLPDDPAPPPPFGWPPQKHHLPIIRNGEPETGTGEIGEAQQWTPTPTPTSAVLALARNTPTPRPTRRHCSSLSPASWQNPGCPFSGSPSGRQAAATDAAGRSYVATAQPRPSGGSTGLQPAPMPTRHAYSGAERRPTPTRSR